MKKKTAIILIIIGLLILFTPIPTGVYKDGGTKVYSALTYKIVKWNRFAGVGKYSKTKVYIFPNNFKSIDALWETVNVEHSEAFGGTIIEINDSNVIVKPEEESWISKSSDKIVFNTNNLEKLNVKIGDKVMVTFNGELMESYPAQINAISWQLCE
ncbi:MAG: DUF3221 domain-containing protein [Clostridia bacterium]|nr:DUF3221 domain-containing protein [Clostridia bacterium]